MGAFRTVQNQSRVIMTYGLLAACSFSTVGPVGKLQMLHHSDEVKTAVCGNNRLSIFVYMKHTGI